MTAGETWEVVGESLELNDYFIVAAESEAVSLSPTCLVV